MKDILSLVDGLYYPKEPKALAGLVRSLLDAPADGQAPETGGIKAVITPHGAYEYCGKTMADAYRTVGHLKPGRIVILAPVHRESEPGVFLPPGDRFLTPLGPVPVDTKARDALSDRLSFSVDPIPFLEEPSVEAQLPFLQVLFPGVMVLPLFFGGSRASARKPLTRALGDFLGEDTLTVITSNLSGYLPLPLGREQAEEFISLVENSAGPFHPGRYLSSLKPNAPRPCGSACLAAWWEAAEKVFSPGIHVCSRGPDVPLAGDDEKPGDKIEKQAFYGGFILTDGGP